MANAVTRRKTTWWIATFGVAFAVALAAAWWILQRPGTPVAGGDQTDARNPASVQPSMDETKRPERATPPPGRFF